MIFMVCVKWNQLAVCWRHQSLEWRCPNCTSPAEKSHVSLILQHFASVSSTTLFFPSCMRSKSFSHLKAPFPWSNVCWSTLPAGQIVTTRWISSGYFCPLWFKAAAGGRRWKNKRWSEDNPSLKLGRLFQPGVWKVKAPVNFAFFPNRSPAKTGFKWWLYADFLSGSAVNLS